MVKQNINRTSSQEDSSESSPQEESQGMFLTLKDSFVANIDAFDFSNDGKKTK